MYIGDGDGDVTPAEARTQVPGEPGTNGLVSTRRAVQSARHSGTQEQLQRCGTGDVLLRTGYFLLYVLPCVCAWRMQGCQCEARTSWWCERRRWGCTGLAASGSGSSCKRVRPEAPRTCQSAPKGKAKATHPPPSSTPSCHSLAVFELCRARRRRRRRRPSLISLLDLPPPLSVQPWSIGASAPRSPLSQVRRSRLASPSRAPPT